MILSETGMVQANMDGGVEEPDPMVLKMMIRMVAKFRGAFCVRARLCISHVCHAADDGLSSLVAF
jgi:hypothetical protein